MDEQKRLANLVRGRICKTPDTCGGSARICGTRLPVWSLVYYHNEGVDVLETFPGILYNDVEAAFAYYDTHREEIDREITENEED